MASRIHDLVSALLITVFAHAAIAAQPPTYRWVDEHGKVHYGDKLPPRQTGLGHAELDKQGRLIQEVKRNRLTPQEQQQQEETQERQEQSLRQSTMQQRRDRALISTFANVKEIEQARDRADALELNKLKGLQSRREEAINRLKTLNTGRPNPALVKHLEAASLEVETLNKAIAKQELDIRDLHKRFESDIARYKQLTEDSRAR